MPIPQLEEEAKAKEKLAEVLKQLSETSIRSLAREDLGTLNFEEGLPVCERILRLYQELHRSSLDNVPTVILNKLSSQAQAALTSFIQIRDFDLRKVPNPLPVHDSIITQIANSYATHFDIVAPVLSYAVRMGTDFDKLEKTARETVENIKKAEIEQKNQVEKYSAYLNESLESVRRAAQEAGVSQHSLHFREQAAEHLKNSKTWIWVTGILAGITLLFGVAAATNLILKIETLTATQSIQLVVAKLIIFSILYSATIWSGRIYKSQIHNYVINKHRQNALSTFEAFVKAAADTPTKNSVLLQATRSIFSCQPSGFTTTGDAPEGPQLLEIVRCLTNEKEKV